MSKVRINGCLQQVEYEALPNIFFKCGLYGHGADWCSGVKMTSPVADFDCASLVMEKSGLE
ncbi:GroES-like zinc-binding alcohol dehydrogenase family protein [Gossypium australe]|uniref:GroES-like zinc-binding alcohol dehydrogenase family protein n=1 Tax=Gossypium australe TaxID=47621 RepID=A0A5B6UGU0_9ROSI|nr:GroES-like zinc-binding alcohol dehydrogenase family protein [Gossypium australe]